jgi:hypothetical protein
MDDGKALVWRHEPEDPFESTRVVGIRLGGQTGLHEAEPGEPQQRVIAMDTLIE